MSSSQRYLWEYAAKRLDAADPSTEPPEWDDEPEAGSCWNCDHMVEVTIEGKTHQLCVKERDRHNGGETGDVYEVDGSVRDCADWEDWA